MKISWNYWKAEIYSVANLINKKVNKKLIFPYRADKHKNKKTDKQTKKDGNKNNKETEKQTGKQTNKWKGISEINWINYRILTRFMNEKRYEKNKKYYEIQIYNNEME